MTSGRINTNVRAVADAVLYEGYLLYPYRANSSKNQSRWQFGVLGPAGAASAGLGEENHMSAGLVLTAGPDCQLRLCVRFLQLQHRGVTDMRGDPVRELVVGGRTWLSWDEAVEQEIYLGPCSPGSFAQDFTVPAGREVEDILADGQVAGRLVRTRQPLAGCCAVSVADEGHYRRLTVTLTNTAGPVADRDDAIARSLIGTHAIAEVTGGEFVSLLDPAPDAAAAVAACTRHRCFPVLAGEPGDRHTELISPIILYDYPQIAEQSSTALFDATEIDEILTLRVLTMTDEEKKQARATDPLAARLIDQCEAMNPQDMLALHGTLRDPYGSAGTADPADPRLVPEIAEGADWWDPQVDGEVAPDTDAVLVNGVYVTRGTRVRLWPSRRADAQDLFYKGQIARVTSVHSDVEGDTHVGVVLEDDPAAELHEWYGRYLYFAPDEVEPLEADEPRAPASPGPVSEVEHPGRIELQPSSARPLAEGTESWMS